MAFLLLRTQNELLTSVFAEVEQNGRKQQTNDLVSASGVAIGRTCRKAASALEKTIDETLGRCDVKGATGKCARLCLCEWEIPTLLVCGRGRNGDRLDLACSRPRRRRLRS